MPYENEHACRVADPKKFKEMRRQNDKFAPGIDAIFGITEDGKSEIQAIRFDKEKYTEAQARKWVKEHDFKCVPFEPASDKFAKDTLETVDFNGQEVFATGEYTSCNGSKRKYTKDDLLGMAAAANEMGGRLSAAVKLGHNKDQSIAKLEGHFKDGMPAFGWMRNFRVQGEKLICDLKQVPKKLATLIRAGAYKFKSLEIAKNFKDEATGKLYKLLPVGVAILGKSMPALSNLNELAAMYENGVPETSFWYKQDDEPNSPDGGESKMSKELEKQIADLTAEVTELTKKHSAAQSKIEELGDKLKQAKDDHAKAMKEAEDKATEEAEKFSKISDELDAVKKENSTMKEEITEYRKAADEAADKEREAFLDKHSKKFPPALRAHFSALLKQADEDPDKFSIDVDGETVTDIRKHIEDMPESDLFSQAGKSTPANERNKDDDSVIEKKVRAYCKENDLDYDNKDHYAKAVLDLELYDKD